MNDKIVIPARCTAKLQEDLKKSYFVGEEKLDGSRYVLYLGFDPYDRHEGNTLLSRRISTVDAKFVDRTFQVPHITEQDYGLDGTILDGEVFLNDFKTTSSIISSGPAVAIQKQKELGWLKYRVFDILKFKGKDIRGLSLEKRRKVLEEVVKRMNNKYVEPIEQFFEKFEERFLGFVEDGGEGIIIKDSRQAYGCGWAKWKKSFDVSCIVTGWKPGDEKGKYADTIGSLTLSAVQDNGDLIEIGFASGFDDKLRFEMAKNFEDYKGRVVDVFAQEISKNNRLRHPTFHRFRDDMNPEECKLSKVKEDLKKKPISRNKWRKS